MTALTAEQAAAIDTAHVVHGVDGAGAYLGLVPRAQAFTTADGPAPAAGWLWVAGQWQPPAPTLAELKAACWQAIKTARQLAMQGTFTCGGVVYDIDPVNITGATVLAMRALAAGVPFSQQWVLADNTTTTLDAEGMCAVGEACAMAVAALWATSTALRAQIDAAQSAEQVAAVVWPQDTP